MYVITELRLNARIYRTFGERNPESTPVGPFDSREDAESYVMWLVRRYQASGASWEVSEVLRPLDEFVEERYSQMTSVEQESWNRMTDRINKKAEEGELTDNQISIQNCRKNWPEAVNGEYNPSCCRFPKSCSIEDPIICPECRNGKHVNCDKMALDAYGNPAACECGHYA